MKQINEVLWEGWSIAIQPSKSPKLMQNLEVIHWNFREDRTFKCYKHLITGMLDNVIKQMTTYFSSDHQVANQWFQSSRREQMMLQSSKLQ